MTFGARFPVLPAETLSGRTLLFPDAVDGKVTLIVLAFRRPAQAMVDSWMIPAKDRYGSHSEFAFFEVPMLGGGWRMVSGFIDSGMRAGIAPEHHAHVATSYGDAGRFRDELGISNTALAYAYLLDREGRIVTARSGAASGTNLKELFATIDGLLADDPHSTS
jgi:hypothetical protein